MLEIYVRRIFMKFTGIFICFLVFVITQSCSNPIEIKNTSIDDADTISTFIGETIINKEINGEYFYYFNLKIDGVIKYNLKSSSLNGFNLDLLDSNGSTLLTGEKFNDSLFVFNRRLCAGSYFIRIKNAEVDNWNAVLRLIIDVAYIPIADYSRYIVGSWKYDKVCYHPLGQLGGCTFIDTSEFTKYFSNGTDSVIRDGKHYGPFGYKFENNRLMNTSDQSDTTLIKTGVVELTYSWLIITPVNKLDTFYVYKRQE